MKFHMGALFVAFSISSLAVSVNGFANDQDPEDRSISSKGDASEGRKVFIRCRACHQLTDDRRPKAGPNLYQLFGRVSGTSDSYQLYSKAMKDAAIIWTEKSVAEYLTKPRSFMPGNKMAFAGIRSEEDRQNLIAYLRQVQDQTN